MNNEEKNTPMEEAVGENSTTKKKTGVRSASKKTSGSNSKTTAENSVLDCSDREENIITEYAPEDVIPGNDVIEEALSPDASEAEGSTLDLDAAPADEADFPGDDATADDAQEGKDVTEDAPALQDEADLAGDEIEEYEFPVAVSKEEDEQKEDNAANVKEAVHPVSTTENENSKIGNRSEKKKTRTIDSVFDFIELFVFTLAAVLIITSFFFRHSIVDGPSMMGTLQDGETLIISDFLYTPKVGDIIVCEDYTTTLKKPIVKRVIATEGQTIRITRDAVYIDCDPFDPGSDPLDEPYVYISDSRYSYFNPIGGTAPMPAMTRVDTEDGTYYELTVPEGEIFVMGDHRNNSTDSRTIGTVSVDSVLGRVIVRVYPFSAFGKVE